MTGIASRAESVTCCRPLGVSCSRGGEISGSRSRACRRSAPSNGVGADAPVGLFAHVEPTDRRIAIGGIQGLRRTYFLSPEKRRARERSLRLSANDSELVANRSLIKRSHPDLLWAHYYALSRVFAALALSVAPPVVRAPTRNEPVIESSDPPKRAGIRSPLLKCAGSRADTGSDRQSAHERTQRAEEASETGQHETRANPCHRTSLA
jgi:hypothetical protein